MPKFRLIMPLLIVGCTLTAPANAQNAVSQAWSDCVWTAVARLDDGKSDPLSIAYGIEPQCAAQYEKIVETNLEGIRTFQGQTYGRRVYEDKELKLITSVILTYRKSPPRQPNYAVDFAEAQWSAAYERGDYPTAFALARPLAEQGEPVAETILGIMNYKGQGVTENDVEAVRWFRAGAEKGNDVSQLFLGIMYSNGQGVSKDETEAARWFRMAAEQGNAKAATELGYLYSSGDGVSKDLVKAAQLFRTAAEKGNAEAQIDLGGAYFNGDGVTKDYTEAAMWDTRAANQGNALAQYALGVLIFSGDGVTQDFVQAHKWLSLAATDASDRDDAMALRNRVEARMTPAQISDAHRLETEWRPIRETPPANSAVKR
jgi:hypothetical protein